MRTAFLSLLLLAACGGDKDPTDDAPLDVCDADTDTAVDADGDRAIGRAAQRRARPALGVAEVGREDGGAAGDQQHVRRGAAAASAATHGAGGTTIFAANFSDA